MLVRMKRTNHGKVFQYTATQRCRVVCLLHSCYLPHHKAAVGQHSVGHDVKRWPLIEPGTDVRVEFLDPQKRVDLELIAERET